MGETILFYAQPLCTEFGSRCYNSGTSIYTGHILYGWKGGNAGVYLCLWVGGKWGRIIVAMELGFLLHQFLSSPFHYLNTSSSSSICSSLCSWPGHVQTPTIQQFWRVDCINLNNGSLFPFLSHP